MNCQNAQDWLLQSDLSAGETVPADVSAHISQCACCQAFARRLGDLEQAASNLPLPPGADGGETFIARLRSGEVKATSARVLMMRRVVKWTSAVAAVLLLAVGAGILVMSVGAPQTAQASSVLDELMDWNMTLADANTRAERGRIYADRVQNLQAEMKTASLNSDDRELAAALLKNGLQMAHDDDPLTAAEGFTDVADLLVRQIGSSADNPQKVSRLNHYYSRVMQRGVNAKLNGVELRPLRMIDRDRKLERILQHNEALRQKLKTLLEQSPNASREEIRRALAVPASKHHKGK